MLDVLEGIAGALMVVAILQDIFLSVIVPRRAPNLGRHLRISAILLPRLWQVWREIGLRLQSTERREGWLGSFGSFVVVVLLTAWAAGLMIGYGLMLFALRTGLRPEANDLGTAIYFAGVAFLTLGFGDIVAIGGLARAISLMAAATGLGLFALVITLLFTLYGSFQRREVAVVVLEAGAGAPPSGVTLLESHALGGILDDLPRVFTEWQAWAAEVLDSHLAYPVLAYFRSSHDNDSWISSLGAVMDAATLVLTTIENGPIGRAKLMRAVGGHCLEDLVHAFELPDVFEVGVERAEFDEARRRLSKAGFTLRDAEQSWMLFSRLRSEYAGRVNTLARFWATPPAQWIGDRSPLRSPRAHVMAPTTPPSSSAAYEQPPATH